MSHLLERVEKAIRARALLKRGQSVLVAVSGGLDSMVLLHVLHELSGRNSWNLAVAHLNHRLRGRSSDADARLVVRTAKKLRLPVVVERADVKQISRAQKLSREMAARKVRHDFLARTAARLKIRSVALAHHADDQLELFFLRLFRGSGGEGLSGMKWRSTSPSDAKIELIRPLLGEAKVGLREYARVARVPFREDASNAWLDIRRNRIRHELLPLLRRKYQPALDRTVLRMMDIAGAEAEFVSRIAAEWLSRQKRMPFGKLPRAVQRRCIQMQLLKQKVAADYELVERLRMFPGRKVTVSPQLAVVLTSHGKLDLERTPLTPNAPCAAEPGRDTPCPESFRGAPRVRADRQVGPASLMGEAKPVRSSASRPGEASAVARVRRLPAAGRLETELQTRSGKIEFGGLRIHWRIDSRKPSIPPKPRAGREFFDADKVGSRLVLRHWQPGDRFQPIGMPSPVKLQDLFTNQKIPREQRRELAVLATGDGELVWVEKLRISERFKLSKETNHRLQWQWKRL